ncbi:hypothetical protein GQX74_006892 [Glossina fuscipes]|nr:hypothetical protein GQX74_006892 [Glossina fuscipes]
MPYDLIGLANFQSSARHRPCYIYACTKLWSYHRYAFYHNDPFNQQKYKPLGVTMVTCCFKNSNSFLSVADYQITFFAGSYLFPLMTISGLYLRMITRLWRQGGDIRMSVESQRGRKRVTRLVVVLVITFALLWLPIQLILLLKALNLYHATTKLKVVLQIVAQLLAYTSSCINPVLYAFLSDNFRKAFHKAINCSKQEKCVSTTLPPLRKTSCSRTSTTGV